MNTVAVIVPVYNMEKYLRQCLDSILEQTLFDFEIICINDGSTDDSLFILEEYKENYKCIRIINQENKGVFAARNVGLEVADAEFVCFMDPDDFYPDGRVLEDLYKNAKRYDVLICGGSFCRFNDNTKKNVVQFDGFYEKYTFSQDLLINYEDYQYDYGYHRFIYSLQLLRENKIVFPPYKRFQDPPFFTKAMIIAEKFYALKRVTYCYRVGHQKINWDAERVIAFSKGVCDNLKISSDYQLADLHAITVQRIIEQKKAIEVNKIEIMSDEYQKCFLKMFLMLRADLVEKSTYNIDVNQLFCVFKNSMMPVETYMQVVEDWKHQYECIRNSKTFRLGNALLWLPKRVFYLLKR